MEINFLEIVSNVRKKDTNKKISVRFFRTLIYFFEITINKVPFFTISSAVSLTNSLLTPSGKIRSNE